MRSRPLVILALLLLAIPMFGRIGTIDVVPSATLLFPYFEVDPSNPNGMNTVLTVLNTSATAVVLNVTLWTDWGIPTQSFPVYLTGYDQETIDLFVLFNGDAPITASVGQDPQGGSIGIGVSPKGGWSQDINFASCTGILGSTAVPIPTDLVAAHRGQASDEYFNGNCGGRNYGDGTARGYITMDTVAACTSLNPTDPVYVQQPNPIMVYQNTMLGDYMIVDRATGRAQVATAANIEASFNDPVTSTPGNPTFYGAWHGNNANDRREPLPSNWAGTMMSGRTLIDAYRDPGGPVSPVTCGNTPLQFPLTQQTITAYDSTGTPSSVALANYFPWAAGRTAIGAGGIPATPKIGWIFLDLDNSVGVRRQSWVTFRHLPEALPATTPFGNSVHGIQMPQP